MPYVESLWTLALFSSQAFPDILRALTEPPFQIFSAASYPVFSSYFRLGTDHQDAQG